MDGKIYRAGYSAISTDTSSGLNISVVNQPNEIGNACDYSHNSVGLGGQTSQIGLPPFVQSIFLYSFDYENICLGDQTHFEITSESPYDSVIWDFGDGQTSNQEEPYHSYAQSGVYIVSLTINLGGVDQEPLLKEVIISEPPAVLQTTFDLVQCDSFDNNPNDGRAIFNLQLANEPLTLFSNEPIQVFYYKSIDDAVMDESNLNSLNNIYQSQNQDELLFAKVYKTNTDCFNMATVRLVTTQALDINTFQLSTCDPDNDGTADFDLLNKGEQIAAVLNLPSNIVISFHEKLSDAGIGVKKLPNIYNTSNTMVYLRAERNNMCYGTGILNLIVEPFPQIEDKIITVCSSSFPLTIDSGVEISQSDDFNYLWNTNQNTNKISITNSGEYSVNIIDPILNCEQTVTVTVRLSEIPKIQNLLINDRNLTVLLENLSDNFIYSVDNENGSFQSDNKFIDLSLGKHTLFVKDSISCNTIFVDFFVFGFPKYFTPNNDGFHDVWNVLGLNPIEFEFPNEIKMFIYDRYGKLLKSFNPVNSTGWDGKYLGSLLTASDYWYNLKLPKGKIYSGHFTLKI